MPGAPAIASGEAIWMASMERKWARSSLTRLGPSPWMSERRERFIRSPRCWRWKLTAKRWASSRSRRSNCTPSCSASLSRGSFIPGRNTSSRCFAREHTTRSSCRLSSRRASITAESWPLPPSIITTSGQSLRPPRWRAVLADWRNSWRFPPSALTWDQRRKRRRMISAMAMKSSEWPDRIVLL